MPGAPANIRWVSFRNDSGEDVPAHGIVQVSGVVVVGNHRVLTIIKPDSSGLQYHYVNDEIIVSDTEHGRCAIPTGPVTALYDSAATPAFGESWGPASGSFKLETGGNGFRIYGDKDATATTVVVVGEEVVCDPQNAIMQITVLGSPTGGTFDIHLTVDGSQETLTFDFDDAVAAVKTELETHTKIAVDDVTVTGGPFPDDTMQIEFVVNLKETNIAIPTADWGSLTGGSGVGVITSLTQLGIA